ncbi:cache domain-containing sensor histidine kinase [Cohnella sp. 56]|uniref:cache domain-containing sensor histidine kinase n=1 Tax=Cohnella sp. 56 TaxID=3113722 RepID=UPI0030E9EF67
MTGQSTSYLPLHYKLLVIFMLLVVIPVAIVGGYSYLSSAKEAERNTRNNLEIAVNQIGNNVQYRVDDVSRSAEALYDDQVLSRYLSGYYLNWERYQVTTQYVLPRLDAALSLPKQKIRMTVYLNEHTLGELYYNETPEALESGDRQFEIRYADRVSGEAWYRSLNLPFDGYTWRRVGTDEAYGYISLLRPLINYETFEPIGLVRIAVKLKDIFADVDLNQLGGGTLLYVLGGDGVLYPLLPEGAADGTAGGEGAAASGTAGTAGGSAGDSGARGAGSAVAGAELAAGAAGSGGEAASGLTPDDRRYLRIERRIDRLPVTLTALVPVDSFKENSRRVRDLTILVCALCVLAMTLVSFLIARVFFKRVSKLTQSLRAFKEGEYSRRIHYRGRDEFADIAESFNDMAQATQKLIGEVYVSNLAKKEAELQILHSQINPHFLYNTFSSISRMAKLGEIGTLHEIIRELAKFYRLTLNKGEMLISVGKELQIVESYLNIQNMKYAGRIRSSIETDAEAERCETVKFVLQPFIENVLEHAWYDDEIEIVIAVRRQGDRLVMQVRDNGLGMKPETAAAILGGSGAQTGGRAERESGGGESADNAGADGRDKSGYGIRNVDQRIKLHYGRQYGVQIESEVGKGTTVTLTLPAVETGDEAAAG